MTLNEIERKYDYLGVAELSYEVTDLTQDELKGLISDLKTAGWKFNRTEPRYGGKCTVAVFEII